MEKIPKINKLLDNTFKISAHFKRITSYKYSYQFPCLDIVANSKWTQFLNPTPVKNMVTFGNYERDENKPLKVSGLWPGK